MNHKSLIGDAPGVVGQFGMAVHAEKIIVYNAGNKSAMHSHHDLLTIETFVSSLRLQILAGIRLNVPLPCNGSFWRLIRAYGAK